MRRALEPFETVLLSAPGRERIHAMATFALIFLFAVSAVDFLIAGGAEFGAPARAAPRQIVAEAAPQNRVRAEAPAPRDDAMQPTEIASPLAETTRASVTPVSQSFGAPLSDTLASAPALLVSLDARQSEPSQAGGAALVGETTEQNSAEPIQPHKEEPRSPRRKAT